MPIGDDTYTYRRDLPHLSKLGKTYFVTFVTRNRVELPPSARDVILACCLNDHRVAYWLHCAVVMPDHVHMVLTPYEDFAVCTIMSRVKGTSSHQVNRLLNRHGALWQREYFDRVIRSDEDLIRKGEYVAENPVRKGIVAAVGEYRWTWRSWLDSAPPGAAAPH